MVERASPFIARSTALELFRNLISLALVMTTNKISNLVGEYGLW